MLHAFHLTSFLSSATDAEDGGHDARRDNARPFIGLATVIHERQNQLRHEADADPAGTLRLLRHIRGEAPPGNSSTVRRRKGVAVAEASGAWVDPPGRARG